jgi:hypothetical protein
VIACEGYKPAQAGGLSSGAGLAYYGIYRCSYGGFNKKLPVLAMFGSSLHSWPEAPAYPRCVMNGVSGFFCAQACPGASVFAQSPYSSRKNGEK